MDRNPTDPSDEFSQEELAQQKTRKRINALVTVLVLVVAAVIPCGEKLGHPVTAARLMVWKREWARNFG